MKLDIEISSMESEMMKNMLVKLFEGLEVVSGNEIIYQFSEINGVLYAVGYEDDKGSGGFFYRRFHKVAIFGALNTLTFHDSNVIDANITLKIEDVVKEVKNTLNHIIKEI